MTRLVESLLLAVSRPRLTLRWMARAAATALVPAAFLLVAAVVCGVVRTAALLMFALMVAAYAAAAMAIGAADAAGDRLPAPRLPLLAEVTR